MPQQALLDHEHSARAVRWIATYALGTAWACLDHAEVVDEVVLFAGGDSRLVEQARRLVGEVHLTDEPVRRRADALLADALEAMHRR